MPEADLVDRVPVEVEVAATLEVLEVRPLALPEDVQAGRRERLAEEITLVELEPAAGLVVEMLAHPRLPLGREVEIALRAVLLVSVSPLIAPSRPLRLLHRGAILARPWPEIDEEV